MRTRIQKWGNSLALRIPRSFAVEAGIRQETEVELSQEGKKLVITPIEERKYTIESLLTGITKQNLHRETDSGPAAGNEIW